MINNKNFTVAAVLIAALLLCVLAPSPSFAAKKKETKAVKATKAELLNVGDTLTLKRGETRTLKAKLTAAGARTKTLTWKSNKPSVVSVTKKGKVKAKKKGVAVVTAVVTAKDGSKRKDSVRITVGTKVKSLSIAGPDVFVSGGQAQFAAQVSPASASNKTVTWRSTDPSVVSIDANGLATFLGAGTARIYAEATDGTKKKARFTVTTADIYRDSAQFIAHRGLSSEAPENSKPAFTLAAQAGFWGVECDVWETAPDSSGDRTLVISHDESLARMTGTYANITDLNYDQVKLEVISSGSNVGKYKRTELGIPTLGEMLDILRPYPLVHAVIELKQEDGMSASGLAYLEEAIKSRGMEGRTILISFGKKALQQIHEKTGLTGVTLKYNTSNPANIPWTELPAIGVSEIGVDYTKMTPDVLATVRAYGMKLGVYTVDDRVHAFDFIRGVKYGGAADHITSNVKLWRE